MEFLRMWRPEHSISIFIYVHVMYVIIIWNRLAQEDIFFSYERLWISMQSGTYMMMYYPFSRRFFVFISIYTNIFRNKRDFALSMARKIFQEVRLIWVPSHLPSAAFLFALGFGDECHVGTLGLNGPILLRRVLGWNDWEFAGYTDIP